ncbi:uncharacterized protein CTRU02_205461 [Colletotrichum truncatum]|uniref:Uncharacterized protein n=1 Tax=Colletotrichum truncatum TaxID=5467 RepID=A0ACC3Z427_COLTU
MKFSATTVALTAFFGTSIANPVKRDVEERQLPLKLIDPLKGVANAGALGFALPPIPAFTGPDALSLPLPPNQAVDAAKALTTSLLTSALNLGNGIPGADFALTGLSGLPGIGPITSTIGAGSLNAVQGDLLTLAILNILGNHTALLNNLGPTSLLNILPGLKSNQLLDIQKLTNGALTNVNPLTKVGGILELLGNLGGQSTGGIGIANLEGLRDLVSTLTGLLTLLTSTLKTLFNIIAQITGGLPGGIGGIGIGN